MWYTKTKEHHVNFPAIFANPGCFWSEHTKHGTSKYRYRNWSLHTYLFFFDDRCRLVSNYSERTAEKNPLCRSDWLTCMTNIKSWHDSTRHCLCLTMDSTVGYILEKLTTKCYLKSLRFTWNWRAVWVVCPFCKRGQFMLPSPLHSAAIKSYEISWWWGKSSLWCYFQFQIAE